MAETQTSVSWGPALATTLLIFIVSMDATVMPIASSAVAEELKSDVGMVQAAISLLSLTAASLYLTMSKLGDIHGKKKIFNLGLMVYFVALIITVVSPHILILIGGWSFVRGIAVALAVPASVALIIASYPDEGQRGQAFAIYGVGGVAASLVGPLLMGYAVDNLSWRVTFAIQAVVILLALFLVRTIEETEAIEGAKPDWGGTLLAFLAIGPIILGSMLGGQYGWWFARRPFMIGATTLNPFGLSPAPVLIGLGVIVTVFLINRNYVQEERGKEPFFSMTLFDNRTFLTSWAMAAVFFILMGALPFILPVFLQQAIGFDGIQTSLAMVAFSTGSIILGFASGLLIERIQPRTLMQLFLVVTAVGLIWLVVVSNADLTIEDLLLPLFVTGIGVGVISAQIPNIQLSTLAADEQGAGSGLAETGKEVGIGLGTAVIGSLMFSFALTGMIDNVARQVNVELTIQGRNELILAIEDDALPKETLDEISRQVPDLERIATEAYVEGFQGAIGILLAVLFIALILSSFIPKTHIEAKKQVPTSASKQA